MKNFVRTLKSTSLSLLLLSAFAPICASAGELDTFGLSAGTLGIGADVGYRITPKIVIRAAANGYNFSKSFSTDEADYDGKLKWSTFGGQVDFSSEKFPLYASIGLYADGNKINVKMTPESLTNYLDAETVYLVDSIDGELKFKSVAPYLAVGAKTNLGGFQAALEVGALFQGTAKVSLRAQGADANKPAVVDALNRETQGLINDTKDYKVWPAISIKLRRKF